MARDTLGLLQTLRQIAADQAVQSLAIRVAAETAAAVVVAAIEDAVPIERTFADAKADTPHAMEEYARWSEEARSRRTAARAALVRTQTETADAHAQLTLARSGTRAVEALIMVRSARAREVAERREAHALDDLARARRPRG
jgi:flagellar export protein FliJ